MGLFCSSLGQHNFPAAFSWMVCWWIVFNLSWWFLWVLWGSTWASGLYCFGLGSSLWYRWCWLFIAFGWTWNRRRLRLRRLFHNISLIVGWRCGVLMTWRFTGWSWLSFSRACSWSTASFARWSALPSSVLLRRLLGHWLWDYIHNILFLGGCRCFRSRLLPCLDISWICILQELSFFSLFLLLVVELSLNVFLLLFNRVH